MRQELRKKIISYNRTAARHKEAAEDLIALLGALPPGQVKQLMNNAACAAVLKKYGITG